MISNTKKKKNAQKTITGAKRKAWKSFSIYIRLRDCLFTTHTKEFGKCFTCDSKLPFKELQAGHFIPGRHNANLFSEEGTHAQCRVCNIIKGGSQLEYRRRIIDLYGDSYDEVLEKEAQKTVKYTLQDYIEIEQKYKKLAEELQ